MNASLVAGGGYDLRPNHALGDAAKVKSQLELLPGLAVEISSVSLPDHEEGAVFTLVFDAPVGDVRALACGESAQMADTAAACEVTTVVDGNALGGTGGMVIALGFAVAMNFGSYWFSDRLVLKMHGAREVGADEAPELHGIVRELSQRAGLPMPKVYLMESATPNAFATGRNPTHAAVAM
mgnify:CR=1 FL=1